MIIILWSIIVYVQYQDISGLNIMIPVWTSTTILFGDTASHANFAWVWYFQQFLRSSLESHHLSGVFWAAWKDQSQCKNGVWSHLINNFVCDPVAQITWVAFGAGVSPSLSGALHRPTFILQSLNLTITIMTTCFNLLKPRINPHVMIYTNGDFNFCPHM